jgi:DNA-3-methyladenine glycosylase II
VGKLYVSKPDNFSFSECLWFLNRNYDDCLYLVSRDSVSRAININDKVVVLTVTESQNTLILDTGHNELDDPTKHLAVGYFCQWFDLERDISPFYRILEAHPVLRYMADDFNGLRVMNIPDVFEALIWSIIGQQINLTFAYKLKRALVEKYGAHVIHNGNAFYTFPEPLALAALTTEELREMQFSKRKAEYIVNAGSVFGNGFLSKEMLLTLSAPEKITALVALKGVGLWTANYVMMKSLNETTGVPHGDVGLLKALANHGLISDRKDEKSIVALFDMFAGWESYLVHYFWRSLAIPSDF